MEEGRAPEPMNGPPAARPLCAGGYVTTAALFAQMAVVEEESGLARLECARGSEVFRPCPMHRGDALRIDLAKIDSSSGVKVRFHA